MRTEIEKLLLSQPILGLIILRIGLIGKSSLIWENKGRADDRLGGEAKMLCKRQHLSLSKLST